MDTNCDGTPTDGDDDVDGHGALACGGDDCDDSDATVYGGAEELCDNRDNDCNGLLDGPGEDDDGDGYADTACGGGDCDDTNSSAYPGAPEGCDGIDLNCDGSANAADDDGDGYGDTSCGGTDCDDSQVTVFPGATERCNGVDDDCDGTIDGPVLDCLDPTPWCSGLAQRCVTDSPCRDGIVHEGEECDDGSTAPFDSCDDQCRAQLLWPPNLSYVGARRPRVYFTPHGTTSFDVFWCRDRACTDVITQTTTTSGSSVPDVDLPVRPVFYRVVRTTGDPVSSPTWQLFVWPSGMEESSAFSRVDPPGVLPVPPKLGRSA